MATNRYSTLLQERADLTAEGEAVFAAAEAEGRGLTAEERAADDQRDARLQEIAAEIAVEERRQARQAAVARPTPSGAVGDGGGYRITGGHNRAADRPWASLGEMLQAVAGAATPGGVVDPRLFAASGASEGVPSDGGFLVRQDFSTQLLDRAMQAAVLAPLCRTIEVGAGSDGVDLPFIDETSRANGSRWGGVQVYWRAEADTVTASRPKFGEHEIRLQELMGIAYATDRLVRDATALESIFTTAFSSEMAFKLDAGIYSGDGVGKPLGMTSSAGPRVEIAKEGGQAADTVLFENVVKMWARCYAPSRRRAVWLYNQDIEPQLLAMSIGVGAAGVPVYLPPNGLSASPFGTLFGRPMIPIEQAATLGDAGDIALVDPMEYLLIRKGGVEAAESMHVRFLYGEKTFRWTYRVNGQPAWRSALTPANGSNTVSPFVTLAARA